jgi:putative tryptophan/tyrosine transport system substrate-binding protein
MSEDAGCADRFLCVPLATVTKPISDLRLLISGLFPLPFALSLVSAMLFALAVPAQAQQSKKIPRVGYISVSGNPSNPGLFVEAFRKALRDLGYIEGKNIVVELRYAAEEPDRDYVGELVKMNVDVLVSSSAGSIRVAKQATKTIPIVMIASFDPVEEAIVDSLARPGGNITGLTRLSQELNGKRLELFKEAVPGISRVGVLAAQGVKGLKEYESAARPLKISVRYLEVRGPNPDLDGVFREAAKEKLNAVIVMGSRSINRYRKELVELPIKNRLPSMYAVSGYVEAGGLMSYSTNDIETFRRAAVYVDKILKGTKPADLPVEQPTKFEFVINLKTAKVLNLTIPQSVLFRADKVIK